MATVGFPVEVVTQDGFPVYLVDTIKHIRYRGKKVGFLGDSITNNASAGAGRDWTRQLKRILGSAVISDVDFVQAGFPGNNSTQILTHFDEYIKDNDVEILFAMMGVNNIIQDLPIEIFIASIKELHRKCVDANIPLILGTITPIRGTEYTVARKEAIAKHNMFLRLYCSQNNIRLADTFTPLAVVSGASAGQANSIYYNVDGIHPNTYGHLYIAKAFADAFNGLFTAPHLVDSINSFNLVANPTLVADAIGWQEQAGGTGTAAVYTREDDTTGKLKYGKWYQADFDATASGGQKYVRTATINLTSAGVVEGDQLLITVRHDYEDVIGTYEFNATVDNPPSTLQLFLMDGSFVPLVTLDGGAVAKPGPVTYLYTVSSGVTSLIVAMFIKLDTGQHVKFKIGEVGVFKVTDLEDIISAI